MSFLIYTALAAASLALPLYIYRYSALIIVIACTAEVLCITVIYGSTFILCNDPNSCGEEWAKVAIPSLIATMNIGMIWPVLAGYAKQAEKDNNKHPPRVTEECCHIKIMNRNELF